MPKKRPKLRQVYYVLQSINRRELFRREVPINFQCDNRDELFDRVEDARKFAVEEARCGLFNAPDEALKNEYRSHINEIMNTKTKNLPLLKHGEEAPYRGRRNGWGE